MTVEDKRQRLEVLRGAARRVVGWLVEQPRRVWSVFRRHPFKAGLLLLAALMALGALIWVPGEWVRRAADPWVHFRFDAVPSKAVAIVPGASVLPSGRPSTILRDRLETARQLYLRGKVQRILVSGDNRTRHYNETQAMRRWLIDRGVDQQHIYYDYAGFRTFDTMERAARVFEVREAIVCTQTFHLYRSVFLARQAGIDAVGLASDLHRYRRERRERAREYLARTLAFADTYVLGTEPYFLGPPIPISGPPQR